jgi:TolB-like protein/DNA-binding winged helix-turn-helix (wHTH) protein/Flp pilus assembly protein TadD
MPENTIIGPDDAFFVAGWRIDPAASRISRDDEEHKIEPKAMTVLVYLAQHQNQVVSRETLEQVAWPDMVVGYDSLASAVIKLRKAFGDDAKNPSVIETVPKKGYRLISTVTTIEAETDSQQIHGSEQKDSLHDEQESAGISSPDEMAPFTQEERSRGIFWTVFALVAVVVMILVSFYRMLPDTPDNTVSTEKVIIAVLPFKNLSDDRQQDYFSDGITVDLITDLSKVSGLSVIARNSVFIFKNTDADIRTVQHELGVDYVVEGSIRKLDDQVRISARLIDASNSINIWADRFDGELKNIFTFQDVVVSKIIDALSVNLTEQDKTRLAAKYSNSIEAYDQFLRGWQNLWLSSREGILSARQDFDRAIELDDQFARAYANLALTYIYDHLHGWNNNDALALQKAHEYADRAIEINPDLPNVYWVKGFAEIFNRNYQQSLDYAQKSIELSPNFADGYGLLATTLNYAGKPDEADEVMRKAMKLNPKHPAIYKVIHGEILFNKRDYLAAIESFEAALDINPEIEESRIWLASAYANAGDLEEASWQLEQVRLNGRELSLQRLDAIIPFKDPAQRKVFIDGLSKAGLSD